MQLWGFNFRENTHTHTVHYKALPGARGHPQIPHFITRPAIPDWSKSMQDNSSTLIPSSLHPCLPPSIPSPSPPPVCHRQPIRLAAPRLAPPSPSYLSVCIVTLIRSQCGYNAVVLNMSVVITDSLTSAASTAQIISLFTRSRVTFLSPGSFL